MYYEKSNNNELNIKFREEKTLQFYKKKEIQAGVRIPLDKLDKYLIQPINIDKQNRNYIIINPTDPRYNSIEQEYYFLKEKKYFLFPDSFLLDIDLKTDRQQELFIKDMQVDTLEEGINKCISLIKNDDCCLYLDSSVSDKGIKAIFCIDIIDCDNYKKFIKYNIEEPSANELKSIIMRIYSNIIKEYLSKYNINVYSNDDNYFDPHSNNIAEGTYSSLGNNFHYNKNFVPIVAQIKEDIEKEITIDNINDYIINNNEQKKEIIYSIKNGSVNSITDEQSKKNIIDNNINFEKFFEKFKKIYRNANNNVKNEIDNNLKNIFCHYNFSLLIITKNLNTANRKNIYKFWKNYYDSNSVDISSYNNFNIYLNKIIKNKVKVCKINTYLKNIIPTALIVNQNNKTKDFFKKQYNQIINFDNYITEQKNIIFNSLDSHFYNVLKSDAGTGKSTLLMQYIKEKFKTLNRIVVCIPKNELLNQQIMKYREFFKNDNIIFYQNYEKGNYYRPDKYQLYDKVLIFSSTPKLHLVKDAQLIVIDEMQNLTKFSKEIPCFFNRNIKTIFISATPEIYLINKTNYHYLYLNRTTKTKNVIHVKETNNLIKMLGNYLNRERNQLIFYNDKSKFKKICEVYPDYKFTPLNADYKKTIEVINVIQQEQLLNTHYVATSLISDGINFNNTDDWDIIIIDNGTINIDEIYQLSCRFRLITPSLYILTSYKKRNTDINIDYTIFNDLDKFKKTTDYLNKLKQFYTDKNNTNTLTYSNQLFFRDGEENVNGEMFKLFVWKKYFFELYKKYAHIYYDALSYYFDLDYLGLEIFDKDENEDDNFDKIGFVNEHFAFIIDKIDDYYRLNKKDITLDKFLSNIRNKYKVYIFNNEERNYINNNIDFISKVYNNFKEVEKYGLNLTKEQLIQKCMNDDNTFKCWFNRAKYKKLGGLELIEISDNDKDLYNTQFILYEKMKELSLTYKDYRYINSDLIIEYYSKHPEEYKKLFCVTTGKWLFNMQYDVDYMTKQKLIDTIDNKEKRDLKINSIIRKKINTSIGMCLSLMDRWVEKRKNKTLGWIYIIK